MSHVPSAQSGPVVRHPLQPHELRTRVTPTADSIVLCHFGVTHLDRESWSLTIDGLVRRSMRLSFTQLAQRPRTELTSIHQCCGNPLRPDVPTRRICNVVWGGVRLSDLMAECQPEPAARYVWASGSDGGPFQGACWEAYCKDLPVERIAADVLIAYEMNGEPLRPENGYPARLVVPGYYGTNSVKWLRRLTFSDARATGPFTTRLYNDPVRDQAGRPTGTTMPVWSIAPEAVIVSPAPHQTLAADAPVELWGWAWADGGVSRVEVSADGERWTAAELEPPRGWEWQRFSTMWRPGEPGRYELRCRAQSVGGRRQPKSGARNAIHSITVTAT